MPVMFYSLKCLMYVNNSESVPFHLHILGLLFPENLFPSIVVILFLIITCAVYLVSLFEHVTNEIFILCFLTKFTEAGLN